MKIKQSILILLVGFFILNADANAQTEQSNWIIGGSSSLSIVSNKLKIKTENQEIDGGSIFSLSFSPVAGYFFTDNLAVGLEFPISYEKSDAEDFDGISTENRTTTFVPTIFARYYFGGSNIRPFLQGGIGYGGSNSKIKSEFGDSESKSTIFQFNFNGGIAIFLNSSLSLDLGVGYINSSSKPKDSASDIKFKNSAIGFNVGFNFFLLKNQNSNE